MTGRTGQLGGTLPVGDGRHDRATAEGERVAARLAPDPLPVGCVADTRGDEQDLIRRLLVHAFDRQGRQPGGGQLAPSHNRERFIPEMDIKVFMIMKILLLALLSAITSARQVNFFASRDAFGDLSRYCVPFPPGSGFRGKGTQRRGRLNGMSQPMINLVGGHADH